MVQIPLYQQKVAPTTQAPSAMADAGSAAAPFRALEQLGGTVSKVGFELQERMDKEETDAQTASYMADRKVRANALEAQLSTMQDPDEIEEFYSQWREDEQAILNETRLNKNAKRMITNNYEDFYATSDIAASSYHRKAKIAGFDRGYIDAQNLALNNETDPTIINPATGKSYTPSELYEYATMKRVDIGTIDYEDAVGDIREFGQNQYFRSASKMATVDYPRFKDEYDPSKLSEYQQQQISLIEQEVEFKIDKQKTQTQDASYNDLLSRYEAGLLSTDDITKMSEENGQAYGQEFPLLTEPRAGVLQSMLYGQEIAEENSFYYQSIQKDIGKLSGEQFNTGDVDAIIRKLYIPQKNGTFKPRFSKSTTKDLLDQINKNFGLMKEIDVKKGPGGVSTLTTEQKGIFKEITDTFDSYTANAERRGDIAIGVKQVEGLYKKFYEEIEGDNLRAWADEALKPFKQQNATDRATSTYTPELPIVDSQESFDALPSGAWFIEDGKKLRKI